MPGLFFGADSTLVSSIFYSQLTAQFFLYSNNCPLV